MTPLEKALQEEEKVNYCDECEQFQIVGNAAYCKVDGKLIHPIMMMRGQGTGPAWNCKKRKPTTHADCIRSLTDEELAEWLDDVSKSWYDEGFTKDDEHPLMSAYPSTASEWLDWLKQEFDT